MPTSRRLETFAAITAALALVGGSVIAVSSAAAAPTVINSTDFQDGTLGNWTKNGLTPTDNPAVVSLGKVLQVSNRANDWEGPSVNLALTAGVAYTVSYKVRLATDLAMPATPAPQARFVAVPGYTWIGNGNVKAGDWTTLSGTFTPSTDGSYQLYLGTDNIAGLDAYSYFVDDISITDATGTLLSEDFEGGTAGSLTGNGGVSIAVVDDRVLSVTNRQNSYDGIQLENPALTAGNSYDVSFRIKLADGVAGTTNARLIAAGVEPNGAGGEDPFWNWIGDTSGVSSMAWTRISGNYTVRAGATVRQLYIETVGIDGLERYDYLVDDLSITTEDEETEPVDPGDPSALNTGFEDGLAGWSAREDGFGPPKFDRVDTEQRSGDWAGRVYDRESQGSGLQHDATGVLLPGARYTISAWVKFAENPVDDFVLSIANTTGGSTSYSNLVTFTQTMSSSDWVNVTGTFDMPTHDTASVYFETRYRSGERANQTTFFIDDIVFSTPDPIVIEDLTPIKDTISFPAGVAIDTRETAGAASQLVVKHFDQITAENHMKPEAWYDETTRAFRTNPQADALMQFAQDNDLKLYGHVLVWHSQNPSWFFQNDAGAPLTTSATDQQFLRDRMRTHIFSIAETLSDDYGLFGSETNPLNAFDVVNEVVADSGEFGDGLRRSEWYRILGESYIDLAFQYADEAFNDEFAAPGSDRPVTLFINDYNTEQSGKQTRYHALVERLLSRGVPIDGVGHQFHVSLAMPVGALEEAILAFQDTGLTQAVTELDVTTGTPVTEAKLVDQGYYYRDAFRVFRAHADDLFSVTVWGLNDGRSWRNTSGAPLVFTDGLQAKHAYYGIVDTELPAPLRTANVFSADVPVAVGATDAAEWARLPLREISASVAFQLRWQSDHLTVFVEVDDATDSNDEVTFELNGETVTLGRDGSGDAVGVVAQTGSGYRMVAELPLDAAVEGDTLAFDLRVRDGLTTRAWNAEGVKGTLTLLESVSFIEVVEASAAPSIDGVIDEAWDDANPVTTSKQVQGTAAVATVHTLWKGDKLYVLAVVPDPEVDVSGSDPWVQDSVELYVDPGNVKNGSYRYDDSQIRISATNVVSFGTGDEAFQRARVQSATASIDGGYLVEAAITIGDAGGRGTFQGLDFQVNDAADGTRTGISNWADPSGVGYQSTARWGVGELVGPAEAEPKGEKVTLGASSVRAGGTLDVSLSGFEPGAVVDLVLDRPASALGGGGGAGGIAAIARSASAVALPATLGSLTVGPSGAASGTVTIPADTTPGAYRLAASVDGSVLASGQLTVLAASIAATGVDVTATLALALLLMVAGAVLATRRFRLRGATRRT